MSAFRADEGRARPRVERCELVRAASAAELEQAAAFRRRTFLERRGVTFDDTLENARDREGYVFLLLEAGAPVATGRALRYPSALSPVLSLDQDVGVHAVDSELGRIATVQTAERGFYSLLLLTLGAVWLLQNTRFERYLAYCHPKLVAMYRLVGAEDSGKACVVPGRTEPHRIVTGTYENTVRLGTERLGITIAEACRLTRSTPFAAPPAPVRRQAVRELGR